MTDPNGRLVVLLSGRGSNFQALAEACDDWLPARIAAVISDRPTAGGLELARIRGIDTVCVDRSRHADRDEFELSLRAAIDGFDPDFIVLAGFMRVLSAALVRHYLGRMINIHPSLLPKYRGLNTHQRALDAGDTEHGASVHFVTPQLDGGPVISRARMAIEAGDTAERLADRLLALEHRLLPATVALLQRSHVEVRDEDIQIDNRNDDQGNRGQRDLVLELGRDLDERGQRIQRAD
jgi:phosphoribosylglycinamide formyltransferase 1